MTARRGLLISIEGIDGCGKSTQAALLCERLAALGLPVGPADAPASVVREPGGTAAGEQIRRVLLHGPDQLSPWTEALLYAAARAELVAHVVRPALAAGRVLVLDRYLDSSLAYQGCARGLGIDAVLAVNSAAVGDAFPDRTVVLEIAPKTAQERATEAPDRIEREGLAFQRAVADGFAAVAARFPSRVVVVDGAGKVPDVAAAVGAAVAPLLGAVRV
jgi:dTMP kinase